MKANRESPDSSLTHPGSNIFPVMRMKKSTLPNKKQFPMCRYGNNIDSPAYLKLPNIFDNKLCADNHQYGKYSQKSATGANVNNQLHCSNIFSFHEVISPDRPKVRPRQYCNTRTYRDYDIVTHNENPISGISVSLPVINYGNRRYFSRLIESRGRFHQFKETKQGQMNFSLKKEKKYIYSNIFGGSPTMDYSQKVLQYSPKNNSSLHSIK